GWKRASAGIEVTNVMMNSTPKIRAVFWSSSIGIPLSSSARMERLLAGNENLRARGGRLDGFGRRFRCTWSDSCGGRERTLCGERHPRKLLPVAFRARPVNGQRYAGLWLKP